MEYSKISLSKFCGADWLAFDEEWNKIYMKGGKNLDIYK